MRRLVLGALRARRGQALVLLLLAVIGVGAAAAATSYADAAVRDARLAGITAGSASDRGISLRGSSPGATAAQIDQTLDGPRRAGAAIGLTAVISIGRTLLVTGPGGSVGADVVARDGLCDHVRLTGACPRATGEVVVDGSTARALGVGPGGALSLAAEPDAAHDARPVPLRVVGVYEVRDDAEPYWRRGPGGALFVNRDTVLALPVTSIAVTLDLVALDPRSLNVDPDQLRDAAAAVAARGPSGYTVDEGLTTLADQVETSERTLRAGVITGTAPVVLIAVLALVLVLAHAGVERRPETALATVRGAPWASRATLTLGPTLLVLAMAGPIGYVVGVTAAWLGVRLVFDGRVGATTPVSGLAVAGLTVAVMVVAALATEWLVHSGPVVHALRRTPARRRWVVGPLDLAVVLLAVAAGYEVARGSTDGLALLAPALVPFAFGWVAARLVLPVTAAAGRALLRRGRLAPALAALQLARRPAGHALLALFVVAVALLGQALVGYDTVRSAVADRAALELGADHLLYIGQTPDAELLAAVAAADPSGRFAMAVSRRTTDDGSLLAVQADRLAAVAGPGRLPEGLRAALTPDTNPAIRVDGGELVLDAEVFEALAGPVTVTAELTGPDGRSTRVEFELAEGLGSTAYRAPVNDCGGGCRLAALYLAGPAQGVRLSGLRQSTPDRQLVGPAAFGTPGRWRPSANLASLSYGPGGLAVDDVMGPPPNTLRLLPVDAAWPLPAIAAGGPSRRGALRTDGREVLGVVGVPIEVVLTAAALPGLGDRGLMIDYASAQRALGVGEEAATGAEVWVTADAPAPVFEALRRSLDVRAEETTAQRAALLWRRGPGQAFALQLLAAAVGLLLALVGFVALARAERGHRRAELRALRVQGLRAGPATRGATLGYAALVVAGFSVGLLASLLSVLAVRAVLPVFADDWVASPVSWSARAAFAGPALLVVLTLLVAVSVHMGRRLAGEGR